MELKPANTQNPKKQNRSQTKQVIVRMTEAEFDRFNTLVSKSELSKSDYLRRAVFGNKIIIVDGIDLLVPELKRIGNNISQITRTLYLGQFADPMIDDVDIIKKELSEVWQLLRQLVAGRA